MRSLSGSEDGAGWREVLALVRALQPDPGSVPDASDQPALGALLGEVARLYSACAVDPHGASAPAALSVGPTEACTAAAALLASESITPFEFSIWYSSRPGASTPRS